jgi:hypothetical protein
MNDVQHARSGLRAMSIRITVANDRFISMVRPTGNHCDTATDTAALIASFYIIAVTMRTLPELLY